MEEPGMILYRIKLRKVLHTSVTGIDKKSELMIMGRATAYISAKIHS